MQDLTQELREKRNLMNLALSESAKRGKELAEKERSYKIGNAEFILLHKGEFAATLIKELAQGDKVVSKLRYERDIANVLYDSAKEAVLSYKLELRIIESQIQREWNSGGE